MENKVLLCLAMNTRNKEMNKMIKHKSTIINQLFYAQMNDLVEKFNKMNETEILEIEEVFKLIKDDNVKSYLITKSNKLAEIIKENKKMKLKQGEIELFSWINLKIEDTSISKVKGYYEELQVINYIEIEGYIIYKKGMCLREYAYSVYEDRLEDEFWVEKMFTPYDLAEMLIIRTNSYGVN